ncbi:MAG: succinylglutamate desuccinylase/aspartoacylase family protein [Methanotrichaceae archaeon]|nr:succinylglutamate desuccinylase/aspartoacylase family protein [Methanotrichaceae archaeon]
MLHEIGSSIWQVAGVKLGTHIAVLGGVHGDEKTGIEVVKNLHDIFLNEKLKVDKGKLTLILGNEETIKIGERGTSAEHNLNRMFFDKHLVGPVLDSYESRRAHELAPILKSSDISLDIHSTSVSTVPFLPCAFTPRHEKIYQWFDARIVLTDPDFVLGGQRSTTDEYVDYCGGIGICFETGWANDTSRLPAVKKGILNILADQGLITPTKPLQSPTPSYKVYRLTRKISLSETGFRYTKGFPESFQEVKMGELIGYHGDKPEIAEEGGVIAFPRAADQWKLGHDIFFIARRIK